jgi:hypothetical protein
MNDSALIPNFYDSVFILNDSSIMQFIIVIVLNMISNSFKKIIRINYHINTN